jgi:protein-disulfide isomerase
MSSGKKSKAARRAAATAPPPVRSKGSKGSPRPRRASPKVLAVSGGVVGLLVVAVVLGVVLSGGKSPAAQVPPVGSLRNGLPGAADVNALFKGIAQHGMTLGSPSAPVTLVEYIDLQCPYCQQFETQALPDILRRYVRTGKVKIVAQPLAFIGPTDSIRGRNAMIAAARQNRAFNFSDLLYVNQGTENTGWLSDGMVAQAAASIPGLKVPQLLSQRNDSVVSKLASTYDAQQAADNVSGTPTFFVKKSASSGKGVPLVNPSGKTLSDALDAALGYGP